jgi:hypothetical protein
MNRLAAVSLVVAATLAVPTPGNADRWNLPTVRSFHSANLRYRLVVTPRQLESRLRFWEDKVAGSEPAGSADPNPKGPFAILLLPRTTSSIVWGGPHRIDERTKELVLSVGGPDVRTQPGYERTRELRIDLATGEHRDAMQALWPHPLWLPRSARRLPPPADRSRKPIRSRVALLQKCSMVRMLCLCPFERLTQAASIQPPPEYPAIAREARMAGTITKCALVEREK